MKVAVIYWSGTGNTEAMAKAVEEGAKAAGAESSLFTVTDIKPDDVVAYDGVALGCPAMGDEVLEESDFQPFFDAVQTKLAGKKVVLFGSYGWGDGAWMRTWEDDCKSAGIALVAESVICQDAPSGDVIEKLKAAGAAIA